MIRKKFIFSYNFDTSVKISKLHIYVRHDDVTNLVCFSAFSLSDQVMYSFMFEQRTNHVLPREITLTWQYSPPLILCRERDKKR